jgi:uncharacterized protein
MKFENAFDVQAPAEDVWQALMDVQRVAPCMPGAEVLERLGDDRYKVGIKVKLGPISMLYRGQVEIVERDDPGRQATMRAKAKEARGQGTADASVHMSLSDQGDGATHATLATEVQLSGKAAAMGQAVIGDVAQRLVEQFAANLAGMLESAEAAAPSNGGASGPAGASAAAPAPPPTPPADELAVGQLAAGVIGARLKQRRGAVIAAALAAALLMLRLIIRRRRR